MARITVAQLQSLIEALQSRLNAQEVQISELESRYIESVEQTKILQEKLTEREFITTVYSLRLVLVVNEAAIYGWKQCGYIGYDSREEAQEMASYITAHQLANDAAVRKGNRTQAAFEVKARGINQQFFRRLINQEELASQAAAKKAHELLASLY
ncbi:hypothetical protein DOP62_13990 (plasmid) [Synechococcus elongatus PCC 11801]|uniref:Uncharacterized protein n=1 Tax=Synechococcus elongatus PCC 11801 TaxID=2219813 RepID=A0ACD5A3B5_SYNEL